MRIGIIAAMKEELVAFESREDQLDELGITLKHSGVCKINAAFAAFELSQEVDAIIVVGTAGALDPDLEVGDIVIARDAVHHDVDVRPLGFKLGQIPFEEKWIWQSDEKLREAAEAGAQDLDLRFKTGRILTGDGFVTDPDHADLLREELRGTCIEMEGAAVAQTCDKLEIPWLVLRIISDKADHSSPVDFTEFLPHASATLAQLAVSIARSLRTSA